jgi:hypothetical protein
LLQELLHVGDLVVDLLLSVLQVLLGAERDLKETG